MQDPALLWDRDEVDLRPQERACSDPSAAVVDTRTDVHSSHARSSHVALLLIDVISDLEFAGGEELLQSAWPAARKIAALKARASRAGVPAIYVNESADRRQTGLRKTIDHCLREESRGRPLVEILRPAEHDYFVFRPQQSVGLPNQLDGLLGLLKPRTLVVAGMAASICVLLAANDLYLGQFRLMVPDDCVVSKTEEDRQNALDHMRRVLDVDIRPSTAVWFLD